MDQAGIFLVTRPHGSEHLARHHFGKTDNGVQRCAQFMAHVCQEARLGAVGGQRGVARFHQRPFLLLSLGDVAGHRHDVGGLTSNFARGAAADFRPHKMAVLVAQPHFGAASAAVIAGFHQRRLHRIQVVGMHHGRHRLAQYFVGQPPQQRDRRGTGETDAPIRRMAGDQVHRIVGEETVHRGAFGGGGIGGALAILGSGGDQHRLHQRCQHGTGIDFPKRQRARIGQPRGGQMAQRLDASHDQERRTRRHACAHHRRAAARQCAFGGHQREPHHQRRCHSARQQRQISDQRGKTR